ncbi:MAG: hypothetical protein JOY78_21385 [Pseudonocardia sp.]|nr:hypothetical protein [Pseudonocardia sp.]
MPDRLWPTLLIMGLDSRLDENGNPLPPELYQAMTPVGAGVAATTPTC